MQATLTGWRNIQPSPIVSSRQWRLPPEDHMSDTAFGFLLAAELSALLWTALLMAAFSVF